MAPSVLIAGVSTRAAADSAARAGFDVTAIDGYADLDQHPSVRAIGIADGFNMPAAIEAASRVGCDYMSYVSGVENYWGVLPQLVGRRHLWGNGPGVLVRARDPHAVTSAFRAEGFAAPALDGKGDGTWLEKPLASGGGKGVHLWTHGDNRRKAHYLQQRIDGMPGSVSFVAARGRAVILGMSSQLVGDPEFGASGYTYCGSILCAADDRQFEQESRLFEIASQLARASAREFDLVGLNGIDFIAHGGIPFPIEINPRWSSSMELVERAHGISMFDAHYRACATGVLTDFDAATARSDATTHGKAIVFARHDVTVCDTSSWLSDLSVRDIPHPGLQISSRSPICTVFATGDDAAHCYVNLVRRARQVYADLSSPVGAST